MARKAGSYRLVRKVAKSRKVEIRENVSFAFTALTALAAVGGLISVVVLIQQVQAAASQEIHSQFQELEKTFVEGDNYKLHPYFHGGEEITTADELYPAAVGMADLHLDFFDIYWSQLPYTSFDETERRTWEDYMSDMFERSPIICHRLNEVKCWYTPEYLQFALESCPQGTLNIEDYSKECL